MQFGRRPRERTPVSVLEHPPRSAGEHFEHAADCETRAVYAFRQLVLDLEQLQAPSPLIRAARRAVADEARHARSSLALARSFGAAGSPRSRRSLRPTRRKVSAFELALENATVGCVGETLGTWLQVFQARAAQQARVRATARAIAKDEARHAALAFRLFDWLELRLGPEERKRVKAAMRVEAQGVDCRSALPSEIATRIGLPNEQQLALVAAAIQEQLSVVCG
jgi:hypothetical protein